MRGVSHDRAGHRHLVVVRRVHEDEVCAVLIQVLVVAPIDVGEVDLRARVEGLVDDLAARHVLELGAHERATLARLHVLKLDDGPELTVEVQHTAVLDVVGGRHEAVTIRSVGHERRIRGCVRRRASLVRGYEERRIVSRASWYDCVPKPAITPVATALTTLV